MLVLQNNRFAYYDIAAHTMVQANEMPVWTGIALDEEIDVCAFSRDEAYAVFVAAAKQDYEPRMLDAILTAQYELEMH